MTHDNHVPSHQRLDAYRVAISLFNGARGEAAECEATLEMAQIVGVIDVVDAVRLRKLAARAMGVDRRS